MTYKHFIFDSKHSHLHVYHKKKTSCMQIASFRLVVCLFVVTPPLPRDGGTALTAIQVHAVNLIEIRLGEKWQPISNQF